MKRRLILSAGVAWGLAACGGGGSSDSGSNGGTETPPGPAADLALSGRSIYKLRSQGTGASAPWAALAQRARRLEDNTEPDRELLLSRPATAEPLRWSAPAGWSLIDFAWHASGELSIVLATATTLRLLRLDTQARVLADQAFTDAGAASDPFIGSDSGATRDDSLLPRPTRDTVRLAAQGEDAVMALRTGRHAVVAYGLRWQAIGGFATRWRTLVEPGVTINAIALTSGSFDPFAGIEMQWHVLLDVAADGRIALAVALDETELAAGHGEHFGEPLAQAAVSGVLLTRLAADGRRLGTTVIDSGQRAEPYGLRWAGDRIVVTGRVRPTVRPDGSSWDGWLAWVAADSGQLLQQQVLDVDRSDVVFDAVPLSGGRWLLAGASGYWQNPGGRSISEEAAPLLAVMPAPGQPAQRLALAAAARHNQARCLAGNGTRWWVGGMHNGPGTHTADADPALLRADGFVRAVEVAAP